MPMDTDDLAAVLAGGFAKLQEAQHLQAPSEGEESHGRDRDGFVDTVVDGRGILTDIRFADDVGELSPADLESAVLESLQAAYRGTGRPRARSLPDIGSSEVSAQARHILGMDGI